MLAHCQWATNLKVTVRGAGNRFGPTVCQCTCTVYRDYSMYISASDKVLARGKRGRRQSVDKKDRLG